MRLSALLLWPAAQALAGRPLRRAISTSSVVSVSAIWAVPDALGEAFDLELANGQTVDLAWVGGIENGTADLWVMAYNYDAADDAFAQLLASASTFFPS